MNKRSLDVALEAPNCLIDPIRFLTDYDFVIGSQYLKDEQYRDSLGMFPCNRHVILDSGAFEAETLPMDKFIELSTKVCADEVVVPDVPGDAHQNLILWDEFCSKRERLTPKPPLIQAVPTGATFGDIVANYRILANDPVVDVVGLSYHLLEELPDSNDHHCHVYDLEPREECRLGLIHWLLTHGWLRTDKPHHLLGLTDCRALPIYRSYPWIRSIDTSLPVQVGLVDSAQLEWNSKKPTARVDYGKNYNDPHPLSVAVSNCRTFRKWCNP